MVIKEQWRRLSVTFTKLSPASPRAESKDGLPSGLDWTALIERETARIKDIPDRLGKATAGRGVEVIQGRAAFVAPNAVKVGDRTLDARYIVITTGLKPRALPIPGAEHLIISDAMRC